MRLCEAKERSIAEEILEQEGIATRAVKGSPSEKLLRAGQNRRERTRGKDVERLGLAIADLAERARRDDTLQARAMKAQGAWSRCETLYWKLAMSAQGVARSEARKAKSPHIGFEDLLQEATVGLVEAARRYDPKEKASFGTYARWWVRASVTKAVNDARMVRLPESALKCRREMKRHLDQGEAEGNPIQLSAAAKEVGMDLSRASRLMALQQPRSIEEPLPGTSGTTTAADVLEDEASVDPIEVVHRRSQWQSTLDAIDTLDERSREVVTRRYGLGAAPPETLSSIADDMGVTPQRIRQIQKRAESNLAELASARFTPPRPRGARAAAGASRLG